MLNEIVKRLKRTKTDWLSPNLSEAVRTTDELPKISGSVSSLIRWNTGKTQSGVLKAVEGTSKFPSTQTENASNSTVSIEFGENVAHENLSPCVAAYGWRRTA